MRKFLAYYRQQILAAYLRALGIPAAKLLARFRQADIAFFYQFHKPPYGGGNQFLQALWNEFLRRGLRLENNTLSHTTRAGLLNSHHLDPTRLRALRRAGCRIVHRIDGPLSVYRGQEDGSDQQIWLLNQEFADATIFQSQYSLNKHLELGMAFKSPNVIMNAADPGIFHSLGRVVFNPDRKIRLISSSWSPNPNKGAPLYKWLEGRLDWERFEYTFVGNSPVAFERIRKLPPLSSKELANTLRQHDIYIAASRHDPCSNALIEALSCGLPALYLNSGGHAEIVGQAGISFDDQQEIPALLDQLVITYHQLQASIRLPSLAEIANRYLKVMGIES